MANLIPLDERLTAAVATANGVAGAHPERFAMILERVMDKLPQKVRDKEERTNFHKFSTTQKPKGKKTSTSTSPPPSPPPTTTTQQGTRAFSAAEEVQLAQVLGVGGSVGDAEGLAGVRAMVDLAETIFRRTCAKGYNLAGLGEAVVMAGGSEALATALQQAGLHSLPGVTGLVTRTILAVINWCV
jgi:hypothetical protein